MTCYGPNCVPSHPRSNLCIEVPTPVPQNISGDKVFKEVVKGKRGPSDGP